MGQASGQWNPISTYVHFPWCLKKCPYCDFASGAIRRDQVQHRAYTDAIRRELEHRAPARRPLVSVFFGGGTPSLWAPKELGRALEAVREAFDADEDIEVTVECNPTSIDAERAAALRDVGVNRLSIGVQSLDDDHLRFLGRLHNADGALKALRQATSVMPRVSADLMFGMPGQSAEAFEQELQRILETGVEHISAYALTIEPDTQFGALHRKGRLQLAPEDDFAETFLRSRAVLAAAGFEHYEVSNYAQVGATSRHNQHYWRGADYLGLGTGAVGAMDGRRYRNDPSPEAYLRAPHAAEVFEEYLAPEDRVREALMLGLRTREGVELAALRTRTGLDLRHGRERVIERRVQSGDLRLDGDRLTVPPDRWLHLDAIVTDLF